MSDTPVLSYKKPSSTLSREKSATPSHPSSPLPRADSPQITSAPTSRKVLSRRKALQDFYKIHQELQTEDTTIPQRKNLTSSIDTPLHINFDDPNELTNYMKSTPIEEILKLRNSITNRFNSHDLAKKSIIYDNYYELIKLSQILGDVSKPKIESKESPLDGLGIFTNTNNDSETKTKEINDHDLDKVFKDLSEFINVEVHEFNTDFIAIVKRLQKDFAQDDSRSISSVEAIADKPEISSFPPNIDKEQLVKEINVLLDKDPQGMSQETKKQILTSIQSLLKKLNVHHDELLILQLNELKSKFL